MTTTHYTSDGTPIVDGLRVEDYDAKTGTVSFADTFRTAFKKEHFDGWFEVNRDDGTTKAFNGERLKAL